MKNVKTKYLAYVSVALLIAGVGMANAATEPVDQKTQTAAQRAEAAKQRQEILAMRDATLKRLYKAKPAVRNEIAKAEAMPFLTPTRPMWCCWWPALARAYWSTIRPDKPPS